MSAGLPLLAVSVLAALILAAWLWGGSGNLRSRAKIAGFTLLLLSTSWLALLLFGVFHPVGSWAMGVGFAVSVAALFIPSVHNRFQENENT